MKPSIWCRVIVHNRENTGYIDFVKCSKKSFESLETGPSIRGTQMVLISTHILDLTQGRPVRGVRVRILMVGDTNRELGSTLTNADGRMDEPFEIDVDEFGDEFELHFEVGQYFDGCGAESEGPPFLDTVVSRFRVTDSRRYHIPLLISPWGYSMYRGS